MKRVLFTAVIVFFAMVCFIKTPGVSASASTRLQPSDLTYLGAFRLPDGVPGFTVQSWQWGGYAMTYYPDGDPGGANDGYPGSIFGTGHAWEYQVSEISIPVPVISASKNLSQLNTAGTLQSFREIMDVGTLEIPRVGLVYLPRQGSQSTDKLYFSWGQHMAEANHMTHGWCELNLTNPKIAGSWYIDCPHNEYNTNDIMFEIPASWAAANTPGKLLASGRYRDGGWSGQGPSLVAIGPWSQGNPPANGTSLNYTTLLRYTSTEDPESWNEATNHTMDNYHHSDEWSGAVWLTSGAKSAVVFVGTKGTGNCWYGDSSGPCLDCAGERGWWSDGFEGQFIFYDPDDLAGVASGAMQPHEPQPYATMNVDKHLYHISSTQQWYHLGAASFDRENGYLYVFEPFADDDKPIVHVWQVDAGSGGGGEGDAEIALNRSRLNFGANRSGTVTAPQEFSITNDGTGTMNWTVSDNVPWLSCSPVSGAGGGIVTVSADASEMSAGSYSGTVSVVSSDAANSPQTIGVSLTVYNSGSSASPFGDFATPTNGAEVSSSIPVSGWVLDDIGVESVKIYRTSGSASVYIGDAVFVEGARPDVESAYPTYPENYKAGWGYMMLTNFLPNQGNGTFTIYAEAVDREGNRTGLGSKTITCDNANAVKPFGAIDTPLQGGTASGSTFINWGWVLTPQPNFVPADGSTINIYVDGVNIGNPTYNIYREDIATFFPGYANSSGAVGYFYLDTTGYANGVHIIQWTATDSGGNTDGIGSRFFMIQNSGSVGVQTADTRRYRPEDMRRKGDNRPRILETLEVEGKELEPLRVSLGQVHEGYLLVGDQLRPLPIGSTFDHDKGVLYWSPYAGFHGTYRFVFYGPSVKKSVTIKIKPKY